MMQINTDKYGKKYVIVQYTKNRSVNSDILAMDKIFHMTSGYSTQQTGVILSHSLWQCYKNAKMSSVNVGL